MAEYIEREAVLHRMRSENGRNPFADLEDGINFVKTAPAADVVEVVRCKDCKYFVKYKCRADGGTEQMMCTLVNGTYDENWYCADGARTDGKGEE